MNGDDHDLVLRVALSEDLSPECLSALERVARSLVSADAFTDVTSDAIFGNERGEARVVAKSEGIVSGTLPFRKVYGLVDEAVEVSFPVVDGGKFRRGDVVAELRGRIGSILKGERTALNFLGHLSGVATEAGRLVKLLEGSGIRILDTRKTLPGLRELEKRAVVHGGGTNHRMGLYDMVLIKDNHVDAAGSITEAVRRVRARYGGRYKIEVEARTLREVHEALSAGVDRIMLDNMSDRMIALAARAAGNARSGGGGAEIEVSGNMDAARVRKIRRLPVDFISVGYVTHSAAQADFSMRLSLSGRS
jgi:nicotinate-nucleotide pyrophosphorylase (carboxylating)